MTFFLAGHETTSVGLTWAFEALHKHPEVEQKLVEEITKHFAGKDMTSISPEEIDQVVSESRSGSSRILTDILFILAVLE